MPGGNDVGTFIGVYQDKYTRTADGWKFAQRHYAVLYNDGGSGNMSGEPAAYPELKW
ncbi:MAG: hypothetical protein O7E57_06640 [Gammaproteobacteria bacterium]|nr:hypothetical protein [Gammaproteobacteria bacterium]